jgi:hypothetical protein
VTEQHSQNNVSVLRQSLEDVETVLVKKSGRNYMKNVVTGEHWYSVCGVHADFTGGCGVCVIGAWAHPVRY